MQEEQGEQVPYSADMPQLDIVEWTASEYIAHQKNSNWFIGLGGGAAVISLIIFVVTRNVTSTLVVLLCFIALGGYAVKQPATKRYRITADGIYVDDKFFGFGNFKSFSVMEEGAVDCIWLRPLKKFTPTVAMYYPPTDEDRIIMMLENFLPIEDRVHDMVDRITRKIRF